MGDDIEDRHDNAAADWAGQLAGSGGVVAVGFVAGGARKHRRGVALSGWPGVGACPDPGRFGFGGRGLRHRRAHPGPGGVFRFVDLHAVVAVRRRRLVWAGGGGRRAVLRVVYAGGGGVGWFEVGGGRLVRVCVLVVERRVVVVGAAVSGDVVGVVGGGDWRAVASGRLEWLSALVVRHRDVHRDRTDGNDGDGCVLAAWFDHSSVGCGGDRQRGVGVVVDGCRGDMVGGADIGRPVSARGVVGVAAGAR